MRAAAIFRFARVSRAAIVGSLTRKACATSGVATPQTSRSVSATWASRPSAGWQQTKTSRSRSSGNSSGSPASPSSSPSRSTSRGSFASSVRERRSRLSAVRFATVTSHAAGRSGTPSRGQVRSARS
jgi:hypothetical protein